MIRWQRGLASLGSICVCVFMGCGSSGGVAGTPSSSARASSSSSSGGGVSTGSSSSHASSSSSASGPSSGASSSAGPSSGVAPPLAGPSDAPYTIQGPTILGASGHPHLFRGLAYPSLEWNPAGLSARNGGQSPGQTDFDIIQSWNANVVRIPLNQDFWLQDNPFSSSSYQGMVDSEVGWAENDNLDVILDLHWSDRGDPSVMQGCCPSGPGTNCSGDCQQVMADSRSLAFWKDVAAHYASDKHVLFELYNEPHDVALSVWLNGSPAGSTVSGSSINPSSSTSSFAVVGMQQLYDAVNAAANTGSNPNHLIVVGGLQYAYDLSGISPTGTHVNGTNVIYNTHPYQHNSGSASDWQAHFGFLSADYPVIATEFGDDATSQSTSCDATFDTNLTAYMDQKATGTNPANKISWTAWAFFNSNCMFPSLIMDSNYGPNAPGMVVQSALTAGP